MRRLICGSVVFILCACNKTVPIKNKTTIIPLAHNNSVFIEYPTEPSIIFLGRMERSKSNEGGSVMYPGVGGAGGLLAGILVHAAVQNSANNKAKNNRLKKANHILRRYNDVIGDLTYADIFNSVSVNDKHVSNYHNMYDDLNVMMLRVEPVFYLTQNQKTIILKNKITFYESKYSEKVISSHIVEVHSRPKNIDDMESYWAENSFESFKKSIRNIFEESVTLGLNTYKKDNNSKAKTVVFSDAGQKQVERGVILFKDCTNTAFITLRGVTKFVPNYPVKYQDDCVI